MRLDIFTLKKVENFTLPQTKTISAPFAPHQKLKDLHLALFVCALVAVDLVILFIYTLVEGVRGGLEPMRVSNTENPSDKLGVSMMIQAREMD